VCGVADDPDGRAVFAGVTTAWRDLPHERRRRVQLAALPMADPSECCPEPELARRCGAAARERVRRDFLGIRLLADYAELVEELVAGSPAAAVG
jgi:hypothetical protein